MFILMWALSVHNDAVIFKLFLFGAVELHDHTLQRQLFYRPVGDGLVDGVHDVDGALEGDYTLLFTLGN